MRVLVLSFLAFFLSAAVNIKTDCGTLGYADDSTEWDDCAEGALISCPTDSAYKVCTKRKSEYTLSACPDRATCTQEPRFRLNGCKDGYELQNGSCVQKGDGCAEGYTKFDVDDEFCDYDLWYPYSTSASDSRCPIGEIDANEWSDIFFCEGNWEEQTSGCHKCIGEVGDKEGCIDELKRCITDWGTPCEELGEYTDGEWMDSSFICERIRESCQDPVHNADADGIAMMCYDHHESDCVLGYDNCLGENLVESEVAIELTEAICARCVQD